MVGNKNKYLDPRRRYDDGTKQAAATWQSDALNL
jgi:hypothetical protein